MASNSRWSPSADSGGTRCSTCHTRPAAPPLRARAGHPHHALEEPPVVMCRTTAPTALGRQQRPDQFPFLVQQTNPLAQRRLQKAALNQPGTKPSTFVHVAYNVVRVGSQRCTRSLPRGRSGIGGYFAPGRFCAEDLPQAPIRPGRSARPLRAKRAPPPHRRSGRHARRVKPLSRAEK
jgi:hypothetical protein